jgi:hypothetical protein
MEYGSGSSPELLYHPLNHVYKSLDIWLLEKINKIDDLSHLKVIKIKDTFKICFELVSLTLFCYYF